MTPRLDDAGDDPLDRSAWFNQGDAHICSGQFFDDRAFS
jgi:hypothetical protein